MTGDEIAAEIYRMTGLPVRADDPVVAACLFYSKELRGILETNRSDFAVALQGMEAHFRGVIQEEVARVVMLAASERIKNETQAVEILSRMTAPGQAHSVLEDIRPGKPALRDLPLRATLTRRKVGAWRIWLVIMISVSVGVVATALCLTLAREETIEMQIGRAVLAASQLACKQKTGDSK